MRRAKIELPKDIKLMCCNTRYMCSKNCQVHENVNQNYWTSRTRLPQVTPQTVAQTSDKLTPGQSNRGKTKTVGATTPELGPVGFWSLQSTSFSGSDSIVVEEAARNFRSPRPSINKSGAPNFFIQHDKVEVSKCCRWLCNRRKRIVMQFAAFWCIERDHGG